jgi:DNA-binding transcriptional MerR regulator
MSSAQFLSPSEAANRLNISQKALRLYERSGLLLPLRSAAGWRSYGPKEMGRASEIAALRALGLSLAQVARVLKGEPQCLEPALAAHQAAVEGKARQLNAIIDKLWMLRADLAGGKMPQADDLARLVQPQQGLSLSLTLPWPWGGEVFSLNHIRPLTYIVGPLGSGKTRLAQAIAANLPDASFLGLERASHTELDISARLNADPALAARVECRLAWLIDEGASPSSALTTLLAALEADTHAALVVDMVEQGLDHATQEALIVHLRNRGADARPLLLMTRSSAILDLDAVGSAETIILCPANHSPPVEVLPFAGSPGYEAVATCLATPEVRARTEGVIAWRPQAAQAGS